MNFCFPLISAPFRRRSSQRDSKDFSFRDSHENSRDSWTRGVGGSAGGAGNGSVGGAGAGGGAGGGALSTGSGPTLSPHHVGARQRNSGVSFQQPLHETEPQLEQQQQQQQLLQQTQQEPRQQLSPQTSFSSTQHLSPQHPVSPVALVQRQVSNFFFHSF